MGKCGTPTKARTKSGTVSQKLRVESKVSLLRLYLIINPIFIYNLGPRKFRRYIWAGKGIPFWGPPVLNCLCSQVSY